MATFFDTAKRNFTTVPVDADSKIATTEFLEAAESVVDLFGAPARPPARPPARSPAD